MPEEEEIGNKLRNAVQGMEMAFGDGLTYLPSATDDLVICLLS